MAIAYSRHGCGYPYQACSRCEAAEPAPDVYAQADWPDGDAELCAPDCPAAVHYQPDTDCLSNSQEDGCPPEADPDPSASATAAASADAGADRSALDDGDLYTSGSLRGVRANYVVHIRERRRCCARDGCGPGCW